MKKYLVVLLVLTSGLGFSQSINDYKYAIVPSKFAFLKEKDQYRMNTMTKMFMEKYGFVTYFGTDILPAEVADQNCNKVYVDVESHGTMFMTKLNVVLKDCKNNVLFTSAEGKSKEKAYQIAYNQALREAFSSFDALGYKYNGSVTSVETVVVKTTNDGATIKKEVVPVNANTSNGGAALFAQPIENGFQLIDSAPKVVLKIYNTSVKEIYIAEGNQGKGILYFKNADWIFEYYVGGKLMSETFKVKF
ncbi:hypothetical protein [Flavobacterium sp. GT3R68]|uniref:hypothetical protein n=1 Tax=Flavobacterium sp. GT3R68 TaxID=2594437 RepID=UPI000F87E416|nr:hypothetical protein [Flavobacterium sp. GT3R68]RTY88491.1 hypothetical protein EKL32_24850 [Flavobacterium sp. GSN2]TRW92591.1 hypothetical protein FNW07_06225 [Flavobacterium sp. GT3R68]